MTINEVVYFLTDVAVNGEGSSRPSFQKSYRVAEMGLLVLGLAQFSDNNVDPRMNQNLGCPFAVPFVPLRSLEPWNAY
jgi:hypothetical protein